MPELIAPIAAIQTTAQPFLDLIVYLFQRSDVSPHYSQRLLREIDRRINTATKYRTNPRNLEYDWEKVVTKFWEPVKDITNPNLHIQTQYRTWFYKDGGHIDFSHLDQSIRGSPGTTKMTIPDVVALLHLYWGPDLQSEETIALIIGELKRAIPRQYILYPSPTGSGLTYDFLHTPNSLAGAQILFASLFEAAGQGFKQALCQHLQLESRYCAEPHILRALSCTVILFISSGPWFMVAMLDAAKCWDIFRRMHPNATTLALFEDPALGRTTISPDMVALPTRGSDDATVPQDPNEPPVNPQGLDTSLVAEAVKVLADNSNATFNFPAYRQMYARLLVNSFDVPSAGLQWLPKEAPQIYNMREPGGVAAMGQVGVFVRQQVEVISVKDGEFMRLKTEM